jgi:30S ribosome assembly GTPase
MIKKCIGCGVLLDSNDNNQYCTRCFRIKHYNDYQKVVKSNDEFIGILKEINKTKDLVLYVVDIFNLSNNIDYINDYLNNDIILVINKRDILPLSLIDDRLINNLNININNYKDIIMISANKNYQIDILYQMIYEYKKSNNIYIVGNTNAGKSTLVNKMIKNYSDNESSITVSPLSSTTLDKLEVKLNDEITLIDTPGLLDENNIIDYVDGNLLKKINPKKEIRTKTYQLYNGQSIIINDLIRIDYINGDKNSFTTFVSNELEVDKFNSIKKDDLLDDNKKTFIIDYNEDLVIKGLGFIKIMGKANINVYCQYNVDMYIRKSII